ncbi:hypothetical protein, partial [Rhizobium leguminosarum]|uniref:hypothetical protein n=1 Tax=Rhizobium leguminosarum TaxID=384 RepID=UPI001FDFA616
MHLSASQGLAQNDLSFSVNAVKLENIFCDINTNRRNLFHGGWLPSKVLQQPILAHSMPSEGAIHHINLT